MICKLLKNGEKIPENGKNSSTMKETEIISKTGIIENSDEKIFNFLSDMRNLDKIIPPNIENWVSTENSCSFNAKGQNISLSIIEKEAFKTIKISGDQSLAEKFNFWIQLKKTEDYKTAARIVVRAKLNMIERAAVKKPMQDGLDTIIDYLKAIPY